MSEREKHTPWWVRDRSQCTMRGIFEEIAKLVERDVDEMNRLAIGRPIFTKKIEAQTMRVIYVCQESELPNSPDHLCSISRKDLDRKITFEPGTATESGKHEGLTIQPRWDPRTAQCQLTMRRACAPAAGILPTLETWS